MQFKEFTRRRLLGSAAASAVGALGTVGTGSVAARPGRYVVGTDGRAGLDAARAVADEVHRTLDFGDRGGAVVGRFPAVALDRLRERRAVRYVEPDRTARAFAQDQPWSVDRIDADVAHDYGDAGAGADVAIVDTGIDADHPDLQANLGQGKAFVSCSGACDEPWDDDNDHGTHCAGTVAAVDNAEGVVGVAPDATLHAVKVLDGSGIGSYSDVAAGITWVGDQGYDVANVSLGGPAGSQVLKDAVAYAANNGVLLVAAAGGSGPCTNCVGYPAAYDEVVAVGATNCDDEVASFSSTGASLELVAPGTDVASTVIGGYSTYSGTSMATAHASGAAALLMADGTPAGTARNTLCATAEGLGYPSNQQGCGLVDAASALGYPSGDDGSC